MTGPQIFYKLGGVVFTTGVVEVVYADQEKKDQRNYRLRYPERISAKNRRDKYRAKYGLTIEQYELMFTAQAGRCAICGQLQGHKRLSVDHNHKTKEIRKLLCTDCNLGVGHFRENSANLRAAAVYLEAYQL